MFNVDNEYDIPRDVINNDVYAKLPEDGKL